MKIPALPSPWLLLGFALALGLVGWRAYELGGDHKQLAWDAEKAEAARQATAAGAEKQGGVDASSMKAARVITIEVDNIVEKTATITKEIPTYVPDTSNCVTVGLVRVLDAAARGTDPAAAALAPGVFNETCAGIGSRALAENIVGNYGKFHTAAAQLTGLQRLVCKWRLDLRPDAPPTEECP